MSVLNYPLKNYVLSSTAVNHRSQDQGVEIRLALLTVTPNTPFLEFAPLASHMGASLLMTEQETPWEPNSEVQWGYFLWGKPLTSGEES